MSDNEMNTPADRVAIAKDALQQLDAGRIHATKGLYVSPVRYGDGRADKRRRLLQDLLAGHRPECDVCAKGALFLSYVGRHGLKDEIDPGDGDDISVILAGSFDVEQLQLIESAFERVDMSVEDTSLDEEEIECAIAFSDHPSSDGRLRAILENIIANNGEFRP